VDRLLQKDRITTSVGLVLGLLMAEKVVALARGIVFARLLGTAEYGIYTLGFFLILITVSVTSLGIPSSFGRYAPRYQAKAALRWFFRKSYVLNIVISVAVGVVILLMPAFFSNLVYGDRSHTHVMLAVGICIPGLVVLFNLISSFSGLKLFRASSVLQLIQAALFALLGTLAALIYRSATGALLAYAVSIFVAAALFLPLLRNHLLQQEGSPQGLDESGFYRHLLRFTIWFTVTPILIHIFHYVDRLSLQRLMTASDQGIYSAAVNLAATISAFGLAVNNVIFPHLSTSWEGGERSRALGNLDLSIRFTAITLTVIGLLVVVLGRPIILLLLGEAYTPGAQVLPLLVVFYILTVSVWLFGVYASLIEKTYVSTIGLACALPVNIGLNLVLIPRLGIVGAGLATLLSYTMLWCIVVAICGALGMPLSRKTLAISVFPMVLLLPKIAATLAVAGALVVCLRTGWVLSEEDRVRTRAELASLRSRLKRRPREAPPGDGPSLP
jgi:O-antigen/teichoic acid export membrane protein